MAETEETNTPASLPNTPAQELLAAFEQDQRDIQRWDWMGLKFAPILLNVVGTAAVALGALAASVPGGMSGFVAIPLALAAGGVMTGINHYRQIIRNDADCKRVLSVFRKDIAELLGKAPQQVTVDDMFLAGDPQQMGAKALKPLAIELAYCEARGQHRLRVATTRSVALVPLALIGGPVVQGLLGVDIPEAIALVGGAAAAVNAGISTVSDYVRNRTMPVTVLPDLGRMEQSASTREIAPAFTLGIMVKLRPDLDEVIKHQFGKPYFSLTLKQKNKLVEQCDPVFNIKALTQAINEGDLSPLAITYMALGQEERVNLPAPASAPCAEPQTDPVQNQVYNVQASFRPLNEGVHAKRLKEERADALADNRRTIH